MRTPDHDFDAIVIGGGHNGLVAAAYLARGGRRVLVLEASPRLGGAAATDEISPDYRISTAAHLVEAMPRKIEKDLRLGKHGLRFAARRLSAIALDLEGQHLMLPRKRADLEALARRSPADAAAWNAFTARLRACSSFVAPLLTKAPPVPGADDAARIFRRTAWRALMLKRAAREDLLRLLPQSIGDCLDETFETPLLKGALAFEAVLGHADGPYAPGTAARLIWRDALRAGGMGASIPAGGLGGLIDALAASARSFGAELRTGAAVARILVTGGKVAGVETGSGEILRAPVVLSSAGPRLTLLDLLGAEHVDAGLAAGLSRTERRGVTAKLNLALDGLPAIRGLAPEDHGARLLIAPSLQDVDEAAMFFRRGEFASSPVMEITIPSLGDPSLAPEGHHVMSVLVQYAPYEAAGGWDNARDRFTRRIVDTLDTYAPEIGHRIIAGELLLPPDIESKFALPGGDWHHGALHAGPLALFRPAPELARYETPVHGLYLCGAGSHPGGGISGLPGRLASEAVLAKRRRK